MGKQHVIELNGKQYDALTGKVVERQPVASPTVQAKPAAKSRGRMIDGFSKAPQTATRSRQPNAATAHQAQKSKTLMRKTVAKPAAKPVVAASADKKPIQPGHSTIGVDPKRLENAKRVQKSPAISRFSAPVASAKSAISSAPKMLNKKLSSKAAQPASVAAAPAQTASQAMIEKALANAKPAATKRHKQEGSTAKIARRFHVSTRQVSATGFVLAALVIAGFFTYQNSSQISMKLAASRAGIHASLPHYQPAGFAIAGGVAYNPGQVSVAYKSTTDGRAYRLSQNVSEWNSQALMDNYVAVNHPNNQTIQDHGKTVYLYDGSNATWVDSGIWYRIEGDSQLSSDQLLNIAASF